MTELSTIEYENTLTNWEKKLREDFVKEYLIDYNYLGAAVRVGFADKLAHEFAYKLEHDPYVRRLIAEKKDKADIAEQEGFDPVQNRIFQGLMREAFNYGPGATAATRINALSKLAAIRGMEAPQKVETSISHSGTVNTNQTFDFSKYSKEELKLIRQLLESRVAKEANGPK